jgi:hypothetical protein
MRLPLSMIIVEKELFLEHEWEQAARRGDVETLTFTG